MHELMLLLIKKLIKLWNKNNNLQQYERKNLIKNIFTLVDISRKKRFATFKINETNKDFVIDVLWLLNETNIHSVLMG